MGRLADLYASVLFEGAVEQGEVNALLGQVSAYLGADTEGAPRPEIAGELGEFLTFLEQKGEKDEARAVLGKIMEMARGRLGVVTVEVVSAVPLRSEQLAALQHKLILRAKKQVRLIPRVDPSLIAGLRLITDDMVMDTSVKSQLAELKEKMYKGVYRTR